MIAVKLLGGALMMAAGILASLCAVARERKRLSVLDAWIELIGAIKVQIDLYLTPLSEILEHTDPHILSHLTDQQDNPLTLHSLLRHSAPFLDADAKRELTALVGALGNTYREEQIKQCEHHLTSLARIRERIAAELPQKTRLYTTLCLCASAGVLILLW